MDETAPTTPPSTGNSAQKIIIGAVVVAVIIVLGLLVTTRSVSNKSSQALTAPAAGQEESYAQLIASLAEKADTLVIGKDCAMTPLVLWLTEGETLTIQNTDNVLHEVTFEDEGVFTVSPNDTRTVELKGFFGMGEGVYRYRCRDVSNDTVGVLYVVK